MFFLVKSSTKAGKEFTFAKVNASFDGHIIEIKL